MRSTGGFGLPSGGPWIETEPCPCGPRAWRVSACLRVGRGLKLRWCEKLGGLARFGLPSGGPWIETPSPYSSVSARRFGLPSGGPWIETACSQGLLVRGGVSACLRVGRGLKQRSNHNQMLSACVSACLRVGRGLKPCRRAPGQRASCRFGLPSGGPWIETKRNVP